MLLEISRAKGIYMYGPDGKEYIDLISGVSVSNTGHSNPRVTAAVRNQIDSYSHLMVYGEMVQSPQVKYAERLAAILPPSLNSTFFVNSGSEAVEGALKLAKRYTGRSRIFSFRNAYHGSTHGALSVQGSEAYRNAFRPLLPDTHLLPFNDVDSLDAIDDNTACVIVEPIQGEGGIVVPSAAFLEKLRMRCNDTRSLLIFDEIQTGFGRTGTMFAFERYRVIPDILLLAKALGGGMPLGAFISSSEIMSSLIANPVLGHITTFGGHPVSCAAGLASLDIIEEEDLAGAAERSSAIFKKELVHPLISGIRGEGLLLAVSVRDTDAVHYIVSHAPDHGLILDYFLFCDDAFRIAPPLIIKEDEIRTACSRIKDLLDETMSRNT